LKLFLGLPQYGGNCSFTFARGLADLAGTFARAGVPFEAFFLANQSLVTRARNTIAARFMASDCTSLLFIDSDIGFTGSDVLELLRLQTNDPQYDVIGGRYRVKSLSGDYAVNYLDGPPDPDSREPVPVRTLATGFMLIRKNVFERLREVLPQLAYVSEAVPQVASDAQSVPA
jgi:hypothetical protein